MTRDELEAAIWHRWPTRGPVAVEAVDAILDAADAYGLAAYGITAERRAALDIRPTVHWQKVTVRTVTAVCHGRRTTAKTTIDRAKVTCDACKASPAWRNAADQAVAS